MSNGVAKINEVADPGLAFVGGHDAGFNGDGADDTW